MTQTRDDGTIEFGFYRPGAFEVGVAGDFKNWARDGAQTIEMVPQSDGWWIGHARFKPGEYRFRYRVDGDRWFTDYASHGIEPSKFGWNSVLIVKAASQNIEPEIVAA